ncbi:MAG: glycogen/starch synthase [Candidatus Omnitrophota bacterium]
MLWRKAQRGSAAYFFFRFNVILLFISFVFGPCVPVGAQGVRVSGLPEPGRMLKVSPAFSPALLRGMVISPEAPLKFDFIVTSGDEKLVGDDLRRESSRMVNYFLAALTTPQQDMWVNLSPVEKDRIIPDQLIKTEMGRDMLAQDYLLKQLTASLIYPEDAVGKKFWDKIYSQAYAKFGARDIPVDVFNKVWIIPEKASVFEKGNAVYVTKLHMKVMLEADYQAKNAIAGQAPQDTATPEAELSKQILRKVIIPVIEQEVNEGKHFAQLRQIMHAIVLAQWYQDALKDGVLNKAYAGKNKVAGIDLSDPNNKKLIYDQYMAAYKKGVFDYIKEETDPATHNVLPRKYFSGGVVVEGRVPRISVKKGELGDLFETNTRVMVNFDKAQNLVEPEVTWNDLNRPRAMLVELKKMWRNDSWEREQVLNFIHKYSKQVDALDLYAVQSTWPVLKAVSLLDKNQEEELVDLLAKEYADINCPRLVHAILLMNDRYMKEKHSEYIRNWIKKNVPFIQGRRIYLIAAEIHHWAGGLGPVMKFHGKGMHDLGADIAYIEPWYQLVRDKQNSSGVPIIYTDSNGGLKNINEKFDEFSIQMGDIDGKNMKNVQVQVASAFDENDVPVYLIKDVQDDGTSFYTRMLYNYEGVNNPVKKTESMAFLNVAGATFLERMETKRKKLQGDEWLPAIVHTNDGQAAPFQAVALSLFENNPVVKSIFWAFTTHTYFNRGADDNRKKYGQWGQNVFLKHMMRIKDRFINAFRKNGDPDTIDHTSGGIRLANWAGAVSDNHRNNVQSNDPWSKIVSVTNGAVPEDMAKFFRQAFDDLKKEGKIASDADYERPTGEEIRLAKFKVVEWLNAMNIITSNGDVLKLDPNKLFWLYARRLVPEKAGRQRAFTDENIWKMVESGYELVLFGNHQGTQQSEDLAIPLRNLEIAILKAQKSNPKKYPGQFRFVESFTPDQKKMGLGAGKGQTQDSDKDTEANGTGEEDAPANGAIQTGPRYSEGAIAAQAMPMGFGLLGNLVMPQEDTADSWRNTVWIEIMKIWNMDENHTDFFNNAALSPRLNRVQRYSITSAAYLMEYNTVLAQEEKTLIEDKETVFKIVTAHLSREDVMAVLNEGRNGVDESFKFDIWGVGKFAADESNKQKGLESFNRMRKSLEEKYGYDALLWHFPEHYSKYLHELFHGLEAGEILDGWMEHVEADTSITQMQKFQRFEKFIELLIVTLEKELTSAVTGEFRTLTDESQKNLVLPKNQDVEGGIDARNVKLDRKGDLMRGVVSDAAMERMLMEAPGLKGVIVGVEPIMNLPEFLGVGK